MSEELVLTIPGQGNSFSSLAFSRDVYLFSSVLLLRIWSIMEISSFFGLKIEGNSNSVVYILIYGLSFSVCLVVCLRRQFRSPIETCNKYYDDSSKVEAFSRIILYEIGSICIIFFCLT